MPDIGLTDGKVVVTGNADGHPVTISGNIKDIHLNVEQRYNNSNDYYGSQYVFSDDTRYYLDFSVMDDGSAFTYKHEMVSVEHRATVEVEAFTMEELEAARARTGAPRDAEIILDSGRPRELVALPGGGKVTFIWTEEKVK